MQKVYLLLLLLIACVSQVVAQTIVTIQDGDLVGDTEYNWTNDNIYLLDGYVFLEAGGKLNIQAGTVIKGKAVPSTGESASALIITVGAQIFAEGTATSPIIFTDENDDINDPNDRESIDRGLWGGLIILGEATIARPGGTDNIEGIPADQDRARYGGTNDADNSGTLRYVSIRHGGDVISNGDEINGLTLGGVGSGTTIEYIEVFANDDDGIEWFGGTVSLKHVAVAFCKDDSYDYDFGWRGKGQFWFTILGTDVCGRGGEHDGASPDEQQPFSKPTIFNTTYIGPGVNATPEGDGGDIGIILRDNAGGLYNNSIITGYPGVGLAIEDKTGDIDSYGYLVSGDMAFNNCVWWDFGVGNDINNFTTLVDPAGAFLSDDLNLVSILAASGNEIFTPDLGGISRIPNHQLDPRPNGTSNVLTGGVIPTDPFFDQVTYRGAFSNQNNWMLGWTALDEYGYLGDLATPQTSNCTNPIVIRDGDLLGNQTYNWTNDNCYLLDGYVFLEAGGVLNIEPGTVIKGKAVPTTGESASALIITVGAQIYAEGAPDNPIIFTDENDNTDNPNDREAIDRGLWGGLILLGDATIARPGGTDNIEGIPADQDRARYGGTNDEDNSGVLRYVSIRHGGDVISNGDEINGLTLGGVGRGTIIEYIEVFANDDDGIEWFGGTVDVRHAAVAFCKDDGFDYDFGWRGRGQYWFAILDTDVCGRAGEHDGASPDEQQPFSKPTISNTTYIGPGVNATPEGDGGDFGMILRDNAGGLYYNSIITEFPGIALAIEDKTGDIDSYGYLLSGDMAFNNCLWWDFGGGTDFASITTLVDPAGAALADDGNLVATLTASGNTIENPSLNGVSRLTDGGLDPRPSLFGAAGSGAVAVGDDFFDNTDFRGAFDPNANLWLLGWTALDEYGYLGNLTSGIEDVVKGAQGITFNAPVPTPTTHEAQVKFNLPTSTEVNLIVVDIAGRLVKTVLMNQSLTAGEHQQNITVQDMANGTYFVVFQAEGVQLTHKLIVTKN